MRASQIVFPVTILLVILVLLLAAAWLFGPLWLALGVASSFGLLIYRQEASPAARAIRNARRLLEH